MATTKELLDERAAELDARETAIAAREAVLNVPLVNTPLADGRPGRRSAGGTFDPFVWVEEIQLSEDGGYNADSLTNRAANMAKRAFSDERIGPLHPHTGMPTFGSFPPKPGERVIRVTVEIV